MTLLNRFDTQTALALAFFFAASYLDFVVHGLTYRFDLTFSYQWAVPYWISYGAVGFLFLLSVRKWWAWILWIGLFQDILCYSLWGGRFDLAVWWWHPLAFTGWNVLSQTILLLALLAVGFATVKKLS